MLITRTRYLEQIRPFYSSLDLVKVLVGMRRVGKSSLMRIISEDMSSREEFAKAPFFFYNFEDWANRHLLDADSLHNELKAKLDAVAAPPVFFLDEIQNVIGWELVINSLRSCARCNIFLTGSNSKLLTGELSTHLAGRYVRFEVFPFSFAEFLSARKLTDESYDSEQAFLDYLTEGGMPGLVQYPIGSESARTYLRDIFESTVIKDMAQRWRIREIELLDKTMFYMMEQIGHRLSGNRIEKFLKSENRRISKDTVINFMDAAVKTYLFHRVESEDATGKQLFRFQPKFYVTDHGLREGLLQNNMVCIDQVLENIVYVELLRRGWQVCTGSWNGREIDFIAQKGSQRIYIQVAYLLASADTIEREFGSLLDIPDNFPKYVVTMDPICQSRKGITHLHITRKPKISG